jgi:predicted O-methyltransferase YrrM
MFLAAIISAIQPSHSLEIGKSIGRMTYVFAANSASDTEIVSVELPLAEIGDKVSYVQGGAGHLALGSEYGSKAWNG